MDSEKLTTTQNAFEARFDQQMTLPVTFYAREGKTARCEFVATFLLIEQSDLAWIQLYCLSEALAFNFSVSPWGGHIDVTIQNEE